MSIQKYIILSFIMFFMMGSLLFADAYSKTSFYIAYEDKDPTQYVLVLPSVNKIYTHKAGDTENLKPIVSEFEAFPTYKDGILCFSLLASGANGRDGASSMAGRCYEVKFFYTQKEIFEEKTIFMLYYTSSNKVYEGVAGDAKSFKVVREGKTVYNENSITQNDYSLFNFDKVNSEASIGLPTSVAGINRDQYHIQACTKENMGIDTCQHVDEFDLEKVSIAILTKPKDIAISSLLPLNGEEYLVSDNSQPLSPFGALVTGIERYLQINKKFCLDGSPITKDEVCPKEYEYIDSFLVNNFNLTGTAEQNEALQTIFNYNIRILSAQGLRLKKSYDEGMYYFVDSLIQLAKDKNYPNLQYFKNVLVNDKIIGVKNEDNSSGGLLYSLPSSKKYFLGLSYNDALEIAYQKRDSKDKVVDYEKAFDELSCKDTELKQIYMYGLADNFATSNIEPTHPRAALSTALSPYLINVHPYDYVASSNHPNIFAETLSGLPSNITQAMIVIGLQEKGIFFKDTPVYIDKYTIGSVSGNSTEGNVSVLRANWNSVSTNIYHQDLSQLYTSSGQSLLDEVQAGQNYLDVSFYYTTNIDFLSIVACMSKEKPEGIPISDVPTKLQCNEKEGEQYVEVWGGLADDFSSPSDTTTPSPVLQTLPSVIGYDESIGKIGNFVETIYLGNDYISQLEILINTRASTIGSSDDTIYMGQVNTSSANILVHNPNSTSAILTLNGGMAHRLDGGETIFNTSSTPPLSSGSLRSLLNTTHALDVIVSNQTEVDAIRVSMCIKPEDKKNDINITKQLTEQYYKEGMLYGVFHIAFGGSLPSGETIVFDDIVPTGAEFTNFVSSPWNCSSLPLYAGDTLHCSLTGPYATIPPIDITMATKEKEVKNCASFKTQKGDIFAVEKNPTLENNMYGTYYNIDLSNDSDCDTLVADPTKETDIAIYKKVLESYYEKGTLYGIFEISFSGSLPAGELLAFDDVVPANAFFSQVIGSPWVCTPSPALNAGTTLHCELTGPYASIPPVRITMGTESEKEVENCVGISSKLTGTYYNINPENDYNCTTLIPLPDPEKGDIAIHKTLIEQYNSNGVDYGVFEISFTGALPTGETLTFEDVVPFPAAFVYTSTGAWNCTPNVPLLSGTTLSCSITGPYATIPPVNIIMSTRAKEVKNCAIIQTQGTVAPYFNTDLSNDEDCDVLIGKTSGDISIEKRLTESYLENDIYYGVFEITFNGVLPQGEVISIEDIVPNDAFFSDINASMWNCSPTSSLNGGDTLTCTLTGEYQVIPPIRVTMGILKEGACKIENCVSIITGRGEYYDNNISNDNSCDTLVNPPRGDIVIHKNLTGQYDNNESLFAVFKLSFDGMIPDGETLVIHDVVPSNAIFSDFNASPWSCSPSSPLMSGDTLTCQLTGPYIPIPSIEITMEVNKTVEGNITNCADIDTLRETYFDTNLSNDHACDTLEIPILTGTDIPLTCNSNIIIVADESGSIASSETAPIGTNYTNNVRVAIATLAGGFKGHGSKAAVIHFDTSATLEYPMSSIEAAGNYPYQENQFRLNYYPLAGLTNWEAGLRLAVIEANNNPGPELIFFITDGLPNHYIDVNGTVQAGSETQSVAEAVAVANLLNTSGSRIIAIGVGDLNATANAQNNLNQIAASVQDSIVVPMTELNSVISQYAYEACPDLYLKKTHAGTSNKINLSPPLDPIHETNFILKLTNNSLVPFTNIIVEDALPTIMEFTAISYTPTHGSVASGNVNTNEVIWQIPTLPSGETARLSFVVSVDTSSLQANQYIYNYAQVTSVDQVMGSTANSLIDPVIGPLDLSENDEARDYIRTYLTNSNNNPPVYCQATASQPEGCLIIRKQLSAGEGNCLQGMPCKYIISVYNTSDNAYTGVLNIMDNFDTASTANITQITQISGPTSLCDSGMPIQVPFSCVQNTDINGFATWKYEIELDNTPVATQNIFTVNSKSSSMPLP